MGFDNVNVNVCGGQSIIKALQNYNTVILKPNIVDNRNVLTQEMISEKHTKYVIRWNYSLEGATINVPKDCIIEFAGGTIDNGTIVGNNTRLIYSKPIDEICKAERQGTWIYDTTVADEEDITSVDGHLKFKDRPATNGMGKVILRNNKSFASQVTEPNTIYVIQYDFVLDGDVTIPANCILEFDGGSLNNGVVTLNGAKISAHGKIFGDNVSFTEESGLVFKATWFGLNPSVDCSDLLENILSYLAIEGTLMVDTDIRLDKPISVSNLYYTNIIGEINPVCIGHHKYSILSDYTPQHTNDQLISIEGEGVAISNVSLVWQSSWEGIEDDVRMERSKASCLLRAFPKTEYHAEGDITVSDCVVLTTTFNCIHATGRGLYVLNCILTCGTYSANSDPLAFIIIKGKANGDTSHYQRPEDAVRGIVIDGNRIHGGKGLYFVRFDQDDDTSLGYDPKETTFYGVSITNNLLDVGTSGIYSTSKIRGLNVSNNTFNLYTPKLNFCSFLNDLTDFSFVNNIISEPFTVYEDPSIAQFNKGLFCIELGNSEMLLPVFKNLNISNNIIDCTGGNSAVIIESALDNGEVVSEVEGIVFKNNIFSSRFATGYGEGLDSTIALVNMKNISANKIVIADNLMCREFEGKDCFALYYVTDSASHDSFLKDVYIGENPGTVSRIKYYNDQWGYSGLTKTNVLELKGIDGAAVGVKRTGTKDERPLGYYIYVGFQYMQVDATNGTFPIWASAISDDIVTWVDATGTPV